MNDHSTSILADIQTSMAITSDIPPFATIDFDNSCIEHDIAEALLSYLCQHQLLRNDHLVEGISLIENKEEYHRQVLARYYQLLDQGEIEKAYRFTIQMIASFTEAEIAELVSKTIVAEGEAIGSTMLYDMQVATGLRVRTDVVTLLKNAQTQGVAIWIVSASPQIVVQSALQQYGIPGTCIGMRLEKDGDILSDRVVEPLSTLEGKVACIKKYIHPTQHPILAIGDSMNDFPMLSYSKIRVVIDRKNKLADEATQQGWYLITA